MSKTENRASRLARLPALLAERILLLDGAMGTMLQTYRLGESDYRGTRFADWNHRSRRSISGRQNSHEKQPVSIAW